MVIGQGEVWWADLREPNGSRPGYRRTVVVVQCDALNQSRVSTVVCVQLTSNLKWADAPGNVLLEARVTGLPQDSVANVSLIVAVDKGQLTESAGKLSGRQLNLLLAGIAYQLGALPLPGRQSKPRMSISAMQYSRAFPSMTFSAST